MSGHSPNCSFTMGDIDLSGGHECLIIQGNNNTVESNDHIQIRGNVTGSIIGGRGNVYYAEKNVQKKTAASTPSSPDPVKEITNKLNQVHLKAEAERSPRINNYTGSPLCYVMESEIRGYCLIINNVDFPNGDKRKGSDCDAVGMDLLFKRLKFDVKLKKNLKAQEMLATLRKFAKLDHSTMNAAVIVILSHGLKGEILGTDGDSLSLQSIRTQVNNSNCPQLYNKPKLFFIQACRGDLDDEGTLVMADHQGDAKPTTKLVPTFTDMLLSYSTVEGFVSIRDVDNGSWYGQAVIQSFDEIYHEEIEDILNKIDEKVQKFSGCYNDNQPMYQATSREKIGWNKKLYFNV